MHVRLSTILLRARYVLPIDGRPIKNGAVRVVGTRIAEVGPVQSMDGTPVIDFGDAVILPGLVNAHTHLELTRFAGSVPPGPDFIEWIERLVSLGVEHSEDADFFASAAREGAGQSLTAGVTTVGDITARPRAIRPVLSHGPLRVVSFGEVIAIGNRRGLLADRLQAAVDRSDDSDYLTAAVSPHAPYTIEPAGIQACIHAAEEFDLRVGMHLAETQQEGEFTQTGAGLFRRYLENLGVYDQSIECPRMTPIELAHRNGVLTERTILAHCNYVSRAEIELMASCGVHVAYCPRTHSAFGHDAHPFRQMLAAGVNVCIGTDSLASNPSLSVLDELRHIRDACPDFDGNILLELATIRGADALGLKDELGSLTPDKSADLTVVPFDLGGHNDPIENLLSSTAQPVATYIRGKRVDRPPHSPRPR